MKKLILLAVVAAVLGGAELGSKAYAEAKLAEAIEDGMPGEQRPSVEVDSFPFIGRLLLSGAVGDIHVRAHAVTAGPIDFDDLELELTGVRVDRDLLLQRQVTLREIDAGVMRLFVDRELPMKGRIPIPPTPLTPCDAEAVSTDEGVTVSCRFDTVPQLFVDVANLRS